MMDEGEMESIWSSLKLLKGYSGFLHYLIKHLESICETDNIN